jgi:hypothetical protein
MVSDEGLKMCIFILFNFSPHLSVLIRTMMFRKLVLILSSGDLCDKFLFCEIWGSHGAEDVNVGNAVWICR